MTNCGVLFCFVLVRGHKRNFHFFLPWCLPSRTNQFFSVSGNRPSTGSSNYLGWLGALEFSNYNLSSYIQLLRGAQLANPVKIRRCSMHLWEVSFIILFCQVTFVVRFYWNVHMEKCTRHLCMMGEISASGHLHVANTRSRSRTWFRYTTTPDPQTLSPKSICRPDF